MAADYLRITEIVVCSSSVIHRIVSIGFALALILAPVSASAARSRPGGHATFLDIFPREHMTCAREGWTFPGLINGHVPLYACILKFRNNVGTSPFGPL